MALSGSDGARARYNLTRTAAAAENTFMYLALMAVGAMLGFVLNFGPGMGTLLTLLLGARGRRLEKEVDELKKRLAAVQGRQQESEARETRPVLVLASDPESERQAASELESGRSAKPEFERESGSEPEAALESGLTGGSAPESDFFRVIREFFTGGNTVVPVGIVILFFGVAFLLRYVAEHSHIPIQFRLSGVACGGIALLALGWRLRARRPGYALTIQGGGVGILYLTTFAALRLYLVLPPAVAFSILVLLAAFSAGLAVVQNSQAFAVLAVAGGFLAPILASNGQGSHVVLFSHYAVLNTSILAIAWYKSWRPLNFLRSSG